MVAVKTCSHGLASVWCPANCLGSCQQYIYVCIQCRYGTNCATFWVHILEQICIQTCGRLLSIWDCRNWFNSLWNYHYTLCAALAVHDLINKLSDTSSRMLRHSCKVYQGRGPGIDLHGSRSQTVRCLSRSVHLVSFYLISLCQICLPTCWTMYCHAITVISWTKSSFNIELNGSTAVYLFKLSCTCVYT